MEEDLETGFQALFISATGGKAPGVFSAKKLSAPEFVPRSFGSSSYRLVPQGSPSVLEAPMRRVREALEPILPQETEWDQAKLEKRHGKSLSHCNGKEPSKEIHGIRMKE